MKDDLIKELERYKKDATELDLNKQSGGLDFDEQSVKYDSCLDYLYDRLFPLLCRAILVVIMGIILICIVRILENEKEKIRSITQDYTPEQITMIEDNVQFKNRKTYYIKAKIIFPDGSTPKSETSFVPLKNNGIATVSFPIETKRINMCMVATG